MSCVELVLQCCRKWSYSYSAPLTELVRLRRAEAKCFHCFQQSSVWHRAALACEDHRRHALRLTALGDRKLAFIESFFHRLYSNSTVCTLFSALTVSQNIEKWQLILICCHWHGLAAQMPNAANYHVDWPIWSNLPPSLTALVMLTCRQMHGCSQLPWSWD